MITLARGIFKGGCDVFRFEQGIVRNDPVARSAGRQQVKDILDANTQTPDAGTPTALVGIHGHAVQLRSWQFSVAALGTTSCGGNGHSV